MLYVTCGKYVFKTLLFLVKIKNYFLMQKESIYSGRLILKGILTFHRCQKLLTENKHDFKNHEIKVCPALNSGSWRLLTENFLDKLFLKMKKKRGIFVFQKA